MKASEKTKENQDEKRPKPVFQESSSLYPNLIDLETELSPPPYADPNPPLLPQILCFVQTIGTPLSLLLRMSMMTSWGKNYALCGGAFRLTHRTDPRGKRTALHKDQACDTLDNCSKNRYSNTHAKQLRKALTRYAIQMQPITAAIITVLKLTKTLIHKHSSEDTSVFQVNIVIFCYAYFSLSLAVLLRLVITFDIHFCGKDKTQQSQEIKSVIPPKENIREHRRYEDHVVLVQMFLENGEQRNCRSTGQVLQIDEQKTHTLSSWSSLFKYSSKPLLSEYYIINEIKVKMSPGYEARDSLLSAFTFYFIT
ncbi:hypothetical protein MJG53_008908 [Ovis ammon polii x Ovis aries]|uniref:Uncharacterized protein n=1 Tax=Ovis ammon polii x Ovis aries TaxID=2918886 RepID=A0ACB9UXZ0_9CETA|nr:hypothetical protein MJT46_008543 [Ovis ammon polii x Ovis aries]KAI4582357.1 hypothetical protein MJG53_008908 [Ovis ammon polii x Ovis aries]